MGDNGSVWRGSCKCMGIVIGGMKGEGGGGEGGGGVVGDTVFLKYHLYGSL